QRARRRLDAGYRFERLCICPRKADRRVARHAAGESMPRCRGHRLEAFLDSLVNEAEAFLEPQHFLADDLEAGVSGRDDSRGGRPHGYFVDAIAFDANERVFLLARLPLRRCLEVAA